MRNQPKRAVASGKKRINPEAPSLTMLTAAQVVQSAMNPNQKTGNKRRCQKVAPEEMFLMESILFIPHHNPRLQKVHHLRFCRGGAHERTRTSTGCPIRS